MTMIVTPIAHTQLTWEIPASMDATRFSERLRDDLHSLDEPGEIDLLAEIAGRACYQAWDLPNPRTAVNEGYLENIIHQGHFSVLEHGSVTFYIEGVSRSLTHELIRHRHLSYSELSQRYVDVSQANLVVPPLVRRLGQENGVSDEEIEEIWEENFAEVRDWYEQGVEDLAEASPDSTKKQIREAARACLPNAIETKIVVTGNLRAWRDFLYKRWHVAADAEIRQLAGMILEHLRELAPHSVQDISEAPFQ